MVEAEGQRLDGWTSANRALLVSPPPGGLNAPNPCRAGCWERNGRSPGLPPAPCQFEPSQFEPVATVEVVINAEVACVLALLQ